MSLSLQFNKKKIINHGPHSYNLINVEQFEGVLSLTYACVNHNKGCPAKIFTKLINGLEVLQYGPEPAHICPPIPEEQLIREENTIYFGSHSYILNHVSTYSQSPIFLTYVCAKIHDPPCPAILTIKLENGIKTYHPGPSPDHICDKPKPRFSYKRFCKWNKIWRKRRSTFIH